MPLAGQVFPYEKVGMGSLTCTTILVNAAAH